MTSPLRALLHASILYTGQGIVAKNGKNLIDGDEGAIEDGALIYSNSKDGVPEKIHWVGKTSEIPKAIRKKIKPSLCRDLRNKNAILPGLIDCHTHLVFAGNRADEFLLRCKGATYEEIAAKGGGIQSSVKSTRMASESELFRLSVSRVEEAYENGVRVLEIKSGYGLDLETELKCLKVVKRLQERFPKITFISTYLGAHAFPKEKSREAYIAEILNEHLPKVVKGKLAHACDVFLDRGYFSVEESRLILSRAKELGLSIKIHGDELSDQGAAKFACEMEALSVDHLLCVNDEGIRALGESEKTTAVLLPLTAHFLKVAHAPGRKLLNAGARVAISTDFNPGSSPSLSLRLALHFGALHYGMNGAELLASVTYNAACALGLQKKTGALLAGRRADHFILPYRSLSEYVYWF